jgi:hypothetical protein
MRFDELNKNNYMLFAIKFYNNPQSLTIEDFEDDLKRIKYIKRLLKRYKNTGSIKVHLVLNHLIVLFNVFDEAAVPLLFYNMEEELWPSLKSFLLFLNRIPEYPKSGLNDIKEDEYCLSLLEQI